MVAVYYEISKIDPQTQLFTIKNLENANEIPPIYRLLKSEIDQSLAAFNATSLPRDEKIAQELHDTTKAFSSDNLDDVAGAISKLKEIREKVFESAPAYPKGAFNAFPDPSDEMEIVIEPKNQTIEIPPDQASFVEDVENTHSLIKLILLESNSSFLFRQPREIESVHAKVGPPQLRRYKIYKQKLVGLLMVGVCMERAQLPVARSALESLKREIVLLESNEVKTRYMRRIGKLCFAIFLAAFLTFLILSEKPKYPEFINDIGASLLHFKSLFLVFAGASIGLFVSLMARRFVVTFEDLANISKDHQDPFLRLAFVLSSTLIASFILLTNMITIEVGGFSSSELLRHGTTAFLIGAFFGFSEQTLPTTISRRSDDFIAALTPNS